MSDSLQDSNACVHVVVTDGSDKYRLAQAIAGHRVRSSRWSPA
jgi:hypothetical protein